MSATILQFPPVAEMKTQRQNIEEKMAVEADLRNRGKEIIAQSAPEGTKAVIVGVLMEDRSDLQSDYHGHSNVKTIVLAWSAHTRDLFSEMRKAALNAPETAYLATAAKSAENREKYSMGAGYYLSTGNGHNGWKIKKVWLEDSCMLMALATDGLRVTVSNPPAA